MDSRHEGAECLHRIVASVESSVARDHRQIVSRQDDEQVVVKDVDGARVLTEVEGGQRELRSVEVEVGDVVVDDHREVEPPRVVCLLKYDPVVIHGSRRHGSDESHNALNQKLSISKFWPLYLNFLF